MIAYPTIQTLDEDTLEAGAAVLSLLGDKGAAIKPGDVVKGDFKVVRFAQHLGGEFGRDDDRKIQRTGERAAGEV